jgi:hypothetical protein
MSIVLFDSDLDVSTRRSNMVSFNMVSLFTEVPFADSLELLSHHFEDDVLALFKHILTSTYFCFDGQSCERTDGVAVG